MSVRVTIINGETKFMGPGVKTLLENIQELSSIKAASQKMGMSYTKSLRILRTVENELGFAVVTSEKGGYSRGGTVLTEKGCQVLAAYTEIEQEVITQAQKLVDEKFVFVSRSGAGDVMGSEE